MSNTNQHIPLSLAEELIERCLAGMSKTAYDAFLKKMADEHQRQMDKEETAEVNLPKQKPREILYENGHFIGFDQFHSWFENGLKIDYNNLRTYFKSPEEDFNPILSFITDLAGQSYISKIQSSPTAGYVGIQIPPGGGKITRVQVGNTISLYFCQTGIDIIDQPDHGQVMTYFDQAIFTAPSKRSKKQPLIDFLRHRQDNMTVIGHRPYILSLVQRLRIYMSREIESGIWYFNVDLDNFPLLKMRYAEAINGFVYKFFSKPHLRHIRDQRSGHVWLFILIIQIYKHNRKEIDHFLQQVNQ